MKKAFIAILAALVSVSAFASPRKLQAFSSQFEGLLNASIPPNLPEIEQADVYDAKLLVDKIHRKQVLLGVYWTRGSRARARNDAKMLEQCRRASLREIAELSNAIVECSSLIYQSQLPIDKEAVRASAKTLCKEIEIYRGELTPDDFATASDDGKM